MLVINKTIKVIKPCVRLEILNAGNSVFWSIVALLTILLLSRLFYLVDELCSTWVQLNVLIAVGCLWLALKSDLIFISSWLSIIIVHSSYGLRCGCVKYALILGCGSGVTWGEGRCGISSKIKHGSKNRFFVGLACLNILICGCGLGNQITKSEKPGVGWTVVDMVHQIEVATECNCCIQQSNPKDSRLKIVVEFRCTPVMSFGIDRLDAHGDTADTPNHVHTKAASKITMDLITPGPHLATMKVQLQLSHDSTNQIHQCRHTDTTDTIDENK